MDEEKPGSLEVVRCLRLLEEDRVLAALLADSSESGRAGRSRGSAGGSGGRKSKQTRHLYTRLLSQYPALLDDLSPALAASLLDKVDHWQFNAFLLDRLTGGHCLPSICVHILFKSGLLRHFCMEPTEVLNFFRLVERGYHAGNPYHNALHASDVTQAMYVYCRQAAILPHLTPLEMLAALVAAVSHDLDHPGVNEKFLVSTGSHLAVLYDNVSVLENHHWRSAISCFVDSGLAKYLTDSQFLELTDLVRSLILATDISRQQEFLSQFRHFLDRGELNLSLAHHRHFILQIAIKCADISNPCRSWDVSRLWSLRACEEFFRQGDVERELGLALTPICDRFNVTVAKVQVGFYTFVVEPLFTEWDRFLSSDLSKEMMESFRSNQTKWEDEVLQEDVSIPEQSKEEVRTEPKVEPKTFHPAPTNVTNIGRRMSLPNNDPLLRIFDQMTQPDAEIPRAVHLRRNFSLTDRRRSSLLRGLYNRSSLKPGRGRLTRPTSVCLENTEIKCNRTLQSKENRLESPAYSMEVGAEAGSVTLRELPADLEEMGEKENAATMKLYERLTRRRGSAPSNLVLSCDTAGKLGGGNILRQQQTNLSAVNTRRGSLPLDLLNESLPKQLRSRVMNCGTTANSKTKGLLRRRSMGPELLNLHQGGLRDRQVMQKYLNRPI